MKLKHKECFYILLIIIAGFAVYSNSLDGKFVWDDEYLIKDNAYIKDWSCLPDIFTKNIGEGSGQIYTFYRPLQMITYMVDYSLWRLDVRGYHITNVLLHILVALAIYWLINIIFKDNLLSLFIGILFVAHPIHTEAVSYISGRSDSLAAFFMLIALILYVKRLSSKGALNPLMLLSYILALLSRESSLIFPVLLLLYHYAFNEKIKIKGLLPVLGITFAYILLRLSVLYFPLPPFAAPPPPLAQRLPGLFVAITNYLRLLFLPFHLHMEYGSVIFGLNEPKVAIGVLLLIGLIYGTFIQRRRSRIIFFSLSWFLITLLPVSNLYPVNAYMAEHWLYLPSLGFFLILAAGLNYIYRIKRLQILAVVSLLGLTAFYSYLTIRQNDYWREPMSFYMTTLRYVPDSARAHYNLAVLYADIGREEEAIDSYERAIESNPNHAYAHNNLGVLYVERGRYEEAIAHYKKALRIIPNYRNAYLNLGDAYCKIGKKREAIESYERVIEIGPDYSAALYYNLANQYKDTDRTEEAIAAYKKAIEIDPAHVEAYYNLANVYKDMNRTKKAIDLYKKTVDISPNYADAYNNLGGIYYHAGSTEEAIKYYKKAIKADPKHATAYFNLCVVYFHKGEYDLAVEYCDKAVELGCSVKPEFLRLLEPYRKGTFR